MLSVKQLQSVFVTNLPNEDMLKARSVLHSSGPWVGVEPELTQVSFQGEQVRGKWMSW